MAKRIGEILVERGLLNEEQLNLALEEQKRSGKFLGEIITHMGFATEEEILIVLASQFDTKFVQLDNVQVNPDVIKLVPRSLAWEYHFLPINMKSSVILIAVSNPLDVWPLSALRDHLSLAEVQIVLAKKDDIVKQLVRYYPVGT